MIKYALALVFGLVGGCAIVLAVAYFLVWLFQTSLAWFLLAAGIVSFLVALAVVADD